MVQIIFFSRTENRWWKRISRVGSLILVLLYGVPLLVARDIHVDPQQGNDASTEGPVKTIKQAIRIAEPGDMIHLQPIIYHEYAGFYGKSGAPGKPITLDGHGATLEGSDPLDPRQWVDKGEGLFECDQLLPQLNDAIIQRWFFLWNGKMVHMGRTSKGPSEPLKQPEALQPGEWTFVKNTDIKMPKPSQISGTFYLKLPPGQKLDEQNIRVPTRSAGVQFSNSGTRHNAHLVIRNLTATHAYNDGFNIHGHCEDVLFENIRAIECGDDGISAHETAQYRVDGFVSIGNSTGICDTGASETSYNRVLIRDCLGFDLYFLDTGRYSLSNSIVLSSAAKTLYLTGRSPPERPCSLKLDNVFIRRMTGKNEVRISKNCRFEARRVTFMGLNFQATGGAVQLNDSIIASAPALPDYPAVYDYLAAIKYPHETLVPEILLWRDVKWTADHNQYELKSLRLDKTFYNADHFGQFQKQTGQDAHSRWVTQVLNGHTSGADLEQLKDLIIPESKTKNNILNSLLPKWE
ncbi:hypothetical protein Pan241w_51970 [Gimesia alba]|uniref:Right handed beta helix domain-containing protein n=1 Tax=Gimesia alba TaxID=2527973 RepID=A0A517RMH2_9PLAN|nr:hypothetical protein [Gimesia alba]QDT45079.1 hypothetical protein Pan241w_51970 [Gimesia alba]